MIWSSAYTKTAIAVVGLGLGALALNAYTAHVRADAQAQATIKAQADYQKMLTSQMADLQKAVAARDAQYAQALDSLNTRFQSAASPQQVAALASQLLGLKTPIQIVTPQPTPQIPHPEPVAQIPLSDAPQAKAYLQDCETCKLQLPKLQADLADREAQMALAQKQIESLQTQRDAAIKASKGGNWVHRLGKSIKVIGCAAAGGAAGGASGKGAIPAAIGAGAGAVACSLF